MAFIQQLRQMIREYEEYAIDFAGNKLLFKLMIAQLKILETEYLKELKSKVDFKER